MNITETLSIIKRSNDIFEVINNGTKNIIFTDSPEYGEVDGFYNAIKKLMKDERANAISSGSIPLPASLSGVKVENEVEIEITPKSPADILREGLEKMIDFFSEFSFTPSFRFVNTLSRIIANGKQADAKNYIMNYFALTDSAYAEDVKEKIKSKEFNSILSSIKQYGKPASTVNSRLKVYYGAAGTGKTTLAQTETDNRCIVCNSSMLPADLMEDFIFSNGQPTFNPSVLYDCMEKGLPIVLDEINLLPFDSLRFLQGITDGKSEVIYKNRKITIKDGFQIIGTMNLTLGGATYGLPEPLVDRCSDIKEFTLTADNLMAAIM